MNMSHIDQQFLSVNNQHRVRSDICITWSRQAVMTAVTVLNCRMTLLSF